LIVGVLFCQHAELGCLWNHICQVLNGFQAAKDRNLASLNLTNLFFSKYIHAKLKTATALFFLAGWQNLLTKSMDEAFI